MELLVLLAFIAASASGAVITPRQNNGLSEGVPAGLGNLFKSTSGANKPVKVEDVKPRIRSTAKRQYIRYGPFALPASKDGGASAGMSHGHGAMPGMEMKGAPKGAPKPPSPGNEPMVRTKPRCTAWTFSLLHIAFADSSKMVSAEALDDPNGFPFTRALDGGFCTDCTVLAAKMDVVLENGTRADIADSVYLHHVVTSVLGKSQPGWVSTCPVGPGEQPKPNPGTTGMTGFVGGAVDEFTDYFTSPNGKINSGYYIPTGSKMMMSGEMINYLKTEQKVYIRMDLEYVPGKQGTDAIKTSVSVDGCDVTSAQFNKPGVKVGLAKSKDYVVFKAGTIVLQRGHMHDGGTGVTSFLNDKVLCQSDAIYGSSGAKLVVNGKKWETINKVKECTEPTKVKPGDRIRLEGGFDYIKHPLRESNGEEQSNMGFMSLTFVPDA